MRLLRELGFQINYGKIEGPSQELTFLGLVLISVNLTIHIPGNKINETEMLLQSILTSKKTTKLPIFKKSSENSTGYHPVFTVADFT